MLKNDEDSIYVNSFHFILDNLNNRRNKFNKKMVQTRILEGPRKEIEVSIIEWMRERKKMQSKRRRKAAGSVREERKERYTYVVKPRLDNDSVRHRRGALFKLYDYLSSLVFHSLPMNDESG